MKKIFTLLLFLVATVAVSSAAEVTYSFGTHADFAGWSSSYSNRTLEYPEANAIFTSANKQGTGMAITDCPVTKGQPLTVVLKDMNGNSIKSVSFVCKQWSTKAQTITLHSSTDGTTFTSTNVTSKDFIIPSTTLPDGTKAVKITFSSTSNQVGFESCTLDIQTNSTPETPVDTNLSEVITSGVVGDAYKLNFPLIVTGQKDNVIFANDGVDIKIDGPTEAHVATAFDDNPSNFTHTNWIVLNAMDNTDFTGKQIAAGFSGTLTNATALEMDLTSAIASEQSTNPITPNTYKLWNFTGIIERDGKVINAYLVTPRENEYVKFDQVNIRIQNGVKTITDSEHRELPIDETYLTLAGDDWNAFPLEAIVKTRPITKASNARGIAADREWVIYPVKQGDIATGVDAITGNTNAAIVKGGAGVINITAVAQGKVEVYSTAGALVANQSIAEGANTISIATGLYIVRIDGKATKVVVR